MIGAKNTRYEGGLFTLLIIFPPEYPKYGPEFNFQNKIYHLNVDMRYDSSGFDHISLTNLNEWASTIKVHLYGRKYNV